MKFLFLDFDGVLHSHSGHSSALWTFLPRLESVLRDYAEARVVVSSSWGDGRSVDELRAFFSNDIQPRIVDKVSTESRGPTSDSCRGNACRRYCRRNRIRIGDWIAIDDDRVLFKNSDPLILCVDGFREREEVVLRMSLAEEIPAWRFAFETVAALYEQEFDRNADRTREYVLTYQTEAGKGSTLSQLFFARNQRAVRGQLNYLAALRGLT